VADLREEHVAPLVAALQDEFYIDDFMIREAIEQQGSFNVIHLETMDKADIFVAKQDAWAREQMVRRQLGQPDPSDPSIAVYFASAEDNILNKLAWYRLGGGVSDQQWQDILGVLRVQGTALDFSYLRRWAHELDLTGLLNRALDDAGLPAV
jgi:hypothetical protein